MGGDKCSWELNGESPCGLSNEHKLDVRSWEAIDDAASTWVLAIHCKTLAEFTASGFGLV